MKGLNNKENLMSQYGGPDGELSASLRYQNQRYTIILKIKIEMNNIY